LISTNGEALTEGNHEDFAREKIFKATSIGVCLSIPDENNKKIERRYNYHPRRYEMTHS